MKRFLILLVAFAASLSLLPSSALAAPVSSYAAYKAQIVIHHGGRVNHYPNPAAYLYATQTDPTAIDMWGTTERQCVGYVSWWLNASGFSFGYRNEGPSKKIVYFTNANRWGAAAHAAGYLVGVKPVVGAVAQWNSNERTTWKLGTRTYTFTAGSSGHVAVVIKVNTNGTVVVAQYNMNGKRSYSTMTVKAPRYLYMGVKAPK